MAPATQAIKVGGTSSFTRVFNAHSSSLQVVCRVRPHLPHERVSDSVVTVDSASSSVGITGKGRTTHFVFSSVYDEISTQADIYRQEAAAFVAKVWNGQHATLFTYGASGSGKTYTVSGCDENEGLIPRSIKVNSALLSLVVPVVSSRSTARRTSLRALQLQTRR